MPQLDVVVAVLAAGTSRRLGRPKQLLHVAGEPQLRRQCRCALDAAVGDVVVILGSNADQHRRVISDLPVDVCINEEWTEGLAATLRRAIGAAQQRRAALLVLPCDQYRIIPEDLCALSEMWRQMPSTACLSRAEGYAGPPAILPLEYHNHVLRLRGDVGARAILFASERPPAEIINPRAMFDLDSPEDATIAEAWNEWRSP